MTVKFQLAHKIIGSSSLMSGGCGNFVHLQPSVVLSIKFMYGFFEDLEDSNVQTIHSLIVGNAISIDKKKCCAISRCAGKNVGNSPHTVVVQIA
jgi:hypothetical protein